MEIPSPARCELGNREKWRVWARPCDGLVTRFVPLVKKVYFAFILSSSSFSVYSYDVIIATVDFFANYYFNYSLE